MTRKFRRTHESNLVGAWRALTVAAGPPARAAPGSFQPLKRPMKMATSFAITRGVCQLALHEEAAGALWRIAHLPRVPWSAQPLPGRPSCGVSHRRRPGHLPHIARLEVGPRLVGGAPACSRLEGPDGSPGRGPAGSGSKRPHSNQCGVVAPISRLAPFDWQGIPWGSYCGANAVDRGRGQLARARLDVRPFSSRQTSRRWTELTCAVATSI